MKSKLHLLIVAFIAIALSTPAFSQPTKKTPTCDVEHLSNKIWEDHIVWTRNVILNILDDLPGTPEAVTRLLNNQKDIGNFFATYYGKTVGDSIAALFTTHITTAADLLTALKNNDAAATTAAHDAWYKNGEEIAAYLASINPYYDKQELEMMMEMHLDLTAQEAVARLQKDYASDVATYDAIHVEILEMSETFVNGIFQQFPKLFFKDNHRMTQSIQISDQAVLLGQNAPNPFEDATIISYSIPESIQIAQIVFTDMMGKVIKKVDITGRGDGDLTVYADNLSRGVFTYSIVADGKVIDQKSMVH